MVSIACKTLLNGTLKHATLPQDQKGSLILNVKRYVILLIMLLMSASLYANEPVEFVWPNNAKAAVSLSYDDALASQLDHAIPALERYKFNASFYLVMSAPTVANRLNDWRHVAALGHELGNHSLSHGCSKSLPNRAWVADYVDLDTRSPQALRHELEIANAFLFAIDGKSTRTFTVPCGDTMAGGKDYLTEVSSLFMAVKGQGVNDGSEVVYMPSEVNGETLINHVKAGAEQGQLVSIVFHGIGGDYLSVSNEAHEQLLQFLAAHPQEYWVDTFQNIMRYKQHAITAVHNE
jgi:peptidoglycan/xylan/chitin deacetylase (PgdA/CDA1 family)